MGKLKGVCVGAGYFSQFHFEAWSRIEEVEIAAICDQSLDKAQAVCNQYSFGKAYTDFEEMLIKEKPDFTDIITPPETHLEYCRLAAKHGVHIICQKPLAPDFRDAERIAEIPNLTDVRMMVHENFRFQPWHRELKKLLAAKVIGDGLHSINLRMRMGDGWQSDAYMNRQPYFREMEKLLIYETGVHFIDIFRYLCGEIKEVYAKLRTLNPNIKGEDFAWVQFEFESGVLGFLDANRYNENTAEDPRLTFGSVSLEGNKGTIRLYDDGQISLQLLGQEEEPHQYDFEKKNFAGDCVFATQKHFIDALISKKPFETNVVDYLNNLKVQQAIYVSHENNRIVRL